MSSSLKKIALKLGTEGPFKTLPTSRLVQIVFGGDYIVKTTNAVYIWEHPYYPVFYVPRSDLEARTKEAGLTFEEVETFKDNDGEDVAAQYRLSASKGSKSTDQIVVFSKNLSGKAEALADLVRIDFGSMDQWFEEDTPIQVHPKNPYTRVDILQSRREIKVHVDGVLIAHASFAMHLYETGLPCRYYLPFTAFDPAVLRPSNTRTKCPYKGEAEYYSVEVGGKLHEDLVWYYRNPTLESGAIVGMLCPYNERVDIEVDGKKLERAQTHFGKPKANEKPKIV